MSIISTKYLLQDAQANGYAVPAFNIHNAETIQAILEVCSEMRSPVILAGTPGTFKHIALEEIYALCSAYSTTYNMPLALHLDHHESLDDIRRKVHAGVRSAMIDGSHFPFAENVKLVKVNPKMHDIKDPAFEKHNHLEQIELRYEKITWTYKDGNIIHSDSWNERATA